MCVCAQAWRACLIAALQLMAAVAHSQGKLERACQWLEHGMQLAAELWGSGTVKVGHGNREGGAWALPRWVKRGTLGSKGGYKRPVLEGHFYRIS